MYNYSTTILNPSYINIIQRSDKMAAPISPQPDPFNAIVSEFGIRMNELEEKQRLLKDRVLLIGNNLVSTKEENDKQFLEIKKQIKNLEQDIKTIKQLNERIINEIGNFARKSEIENIKRQFKMFEPLEFARIKDIKQIVKDELQKVNKEKVNKIK
jgi:hypothetical protein